MYWEKDAVLAVVGALPEGGLLVLDAAYIAFTENAGDAAPLLALGDAGVLRSMAKD